MYGLKDKNNTDVLYVYSYQKPKKLKPFAVLDNELNERDRAFLRQLDSSEAVLFYPSGKKVMYSMSRNMAEDMVSDGRAKVKSTNPYHIVLIPGTREG